MLTREQILALPAGSALDAGVAEHVMGYTVFEGGGGWLRCGPLAKGGLGFDLPVYSTTGSGLLAVKSGMNGRGYGLEVQSFHLSARSRVFWQHETFGRSEDVDHEDLPYAVSLSALLALAAKGSA